MLRFPCAGVNPSDPAYWECVIMSRAISKSVLAAGAAALLSAQAAFAAPAPTPSLDPMVAVSVLASAQSRASLCAGTAAATAAAAGAAAAQGAPANCVLPVTAPAPPPVVTSTVGPPPPPAGKSLGIWPILLGLAAIIAVAALVLGGGDDGDGDLVPISP